MRYLRAAAWLLCLLALILVYAASPIAFAEGEPSFGSIKEESQFPTQIRFSVEARGSTPITRLTLRYRLGENKSTGYDQATFKSDLAVTAQYVWSLQRRYLPPGTAIEYHWEAEDASGRKAQSPKRTMAIVDGRFQWQRLTEGRLTLSWYQGDHAFATDLLRAGTRALNQLVDEVGVEVGGAVTILVYATQQDLFGALPARTLEWTGGVAFPEASVIVLGAPPTNAGRDYGLRTVPHELSHLVVHAATDNPYGGVPQWLDEGLATFAEGEPLPQLLSALESALAHDSLLSLRSLNGNFPTDPQESLLGYAESYSFVRYLLDQYGREKMSTLLAVFREGSTPDDAMKKAYGRDLSEMDEEWRQALRQQGLRPGAAKPGKIGPGGQMAPSPRGADGGQQSCFGGMLAISGLLAGVVMLGRWRVSADGLAQPPRRLQ